MTDIDDVRKAIAIMFLFNVALFCFAMYRIHMVATEFYENFDRLAKFVETADAYIKKLRGVR